MIEFGEPKGVAPFQKEKPPKTEEIFDKPRFEAELQRIKDFPWLWAYGEPSEKEIKALTLNIIKDADILDKALAVEGEFFDSLEALNMLASIKEGEIRATATSILERNMPIIEGHIRNDKNLYNHTCLEAANNLVYYGNEEQKKLGIRVLSDHVDAIAFNIKVNPSFLSVPFIETIVRSGGAEAAQKALFVLQDSILWEGTGEIQNRGLLGWSFMSKEAEIREVADSIISDKLSSYGLNIEKFLDAWRVSLPADVFDSRGAIGGNILAIEKLEVQRPGIISSLNKAFGIYDFGRYPAEMLLWQYDNYDNDELPYGVVLYPRNDHNGAFYENVEVFRQLFEQLKGKFEIRAGEAEDKIEIVKLLHKLNRKYSEKHKISFAIIGGHGEKHSIVFGGEGQKHSLSAWDLWDTKHPVSKKAGYFENEPTFILNSCGTGAEHGIAEGLSYEMKAIVIAPAEPTSIKSIKVEIKNKKPVFSVEYYKERSAQTYVLGNTPGVSTERKKI